VPPIQISNPGKAGPTFQDFRSIKSAEDNHRHKNTKPYLPVIMIPGFKET